MFHILDRAIVAYEAIPWRSDPGDLLPTVRSGFREVKNLAPAVLLVPLLGDELRSAAADPTALVAAHGVAASDVAWVIAEPAGGEHPESFAADVARLRAAGFLIAGESPGWATGSNQRIASLRPDFLVLTAQVVAQITSSALGLAELAGLSSFASRLDMCLIARGVDTSTIATALTRSGIQHGSGAFLSPPLVLVDDRTTAGDRPAGRSWFRQHPARRLATRPRTAAATTLAGRAHRERNEGGRLRHPAAGTGRGGTPPASGTRSGPHSQHARQPAPA